MNILIDSDALFSLFVSNDLHHQKAKQIFKNLLDQSVKFSVSNLVIQETATVLSYKINHPASKKFLRKFHQLQFKTINITPQIENQSWKIFKQQTKRGTSFIDCANIAIFHQLKIDQIFSFDQFYQQQKLPTC